MKLSERAARHVTQQRALKQWSLRKASAESGLSVGTWQRIENGEEVEYSSLVRAVAALGWAPEVADRLAMDQEPTEVPPLWPAEAVESDIEIDASTTDLDALRKADPEAYEQIVAMARIALDRANARRTS